MLAIFLDASSRDVLIGVIVSFLVSVAIMRWIFSIDKFIDLQREQTKYLRAQTRLMKRIAEKLDVSKEDIAEIIKEISL